MQQDRSGSDDAGSYAVATYTRKMPTDERFQGYHSQHCAAGPSDATACDADY